MDFKDQIKQISERVEKMRENLTTEEATKNALIMPFIQALGYDVFNPLEVIPEFTCDIGTKKGEKIDYAIFKDNNPIILIECKHWYDLADILKISRYAISNLRRGIEKYSTSEILERFYSEYDNIINEDWLYEGKGEMLKYDELDSYKEIIKIQRKQISILKNQNDNLTKFVLRGY